MNAFIATIIILVIAAILAIIYGVRSNLRDNGDPINDLRGNNSKSKDINRQTGDIIDKLTAENNEAGRLNKSIGEDNKTAGDIIAEVRKQKLD